MSIPRSTIIAIANAVERQGGDMEDVEDLIATWERLHAGLAAASEASNAGDERAAEEAWRELEEEFSKPLDAVVRDRQGRKR
jgi:hypothetical protein